MIENRQYKRYAAGDWASLGLDGSWHPCSVHNLSGNGLFLETFCRPPIGTVVDLKLSSLGSYSGTVVRHAWDGIGIQFRDGDPQSHLTPDHRQGALFSDVELNHSDPVLSPR
ncbi:PilZ domain-containing protein [Kiloniella laminariae]|uniref:PilZ domain-containing protein n=1 Tax=Kiloniella laminariae TaxID=454162 RepID=A0ABT4LIW7_9PROT|nr:PilZ domain-containing protein [Kiloniella laminariae]MCZ4281051.1 PilZ domain-containing protein [Kiloniella laminariae]